MSRFDFRDWETLVEMADDLNEGDTIFLHVENREIGAKVEIINGENDHASDV